MPTKKIKCFVLSDVHLEMLTSKQVSDFFKELTLRAKLHNPEVMILAGDITALSMPGSALGHYESFASLGIPTVYVTGNHEYYNDSIQRSTTRLTGLLNNPTLKNFHVLTSGAEVNVSGIKFVGDTLWYPQSKDWRLIQGITDHRLISDHKTQVTALYDKFVQLCVPTISKDCVVVTHHMPFNKSINVKFEDDPYNHFFMTDCSRFIDMSNAPRAWIHGHGHDPVDYVLPTNTRVYSNPLAYVNEGTNPRFWDRILVEL